MKKMRIFLHYKYDSYLVKTKDIREYLQERKKKSKKDIPMLTGEDGIITQAKNAKDKATIENEKDLEDL